MGAELAVPLLQRMRDAGIRPDLATYSKLLDVCAHAASNKMAKVRLPCPFKRSMPHIIEMGLGKCACWRVEEVVHFSSLSFSVCFSFLFLFLSPSPSPSPSHSLSLQDVCVNTNTIFIFLSCFASGRIQPKKL